MMYVIAIFLSIASAGCASGPTHHTDNPGQFDTRPARVTRAR